MSSSLAFAGTCAEYSSGEWTEYECCSDDDCDTGEYCDTSTNTCEEETTTSDTTEEEAEDAIDDAENAIDLAEEAGKNVTEAENLMQSAQNSFNAGNYDDAEYYANLAIDAALSAPYLDGNETTTAEEEDGKKKLPCCPAFILLAVTGFLAMRLR